MEWYSISCISSFLYQVLAGQVMHRLKLTWMGTEGGSIAQTAATFRILLTVIVVYLCLNQVLKFAPLFFIDRNGNPTAGYFAIDLARGILTFAFFILTVVLMTRTRQHIRAKYSIPEKDCKGCEDFCCSCWCTCCTVAQMARHTADYESYAATCCSETGLGPNAPSIV